LFSGVHIQATSDDAQALLALHAATAAATAPFSYLEIGSFRGGSLQVLIRDPRCAHMMSIDPRISEAPDETRGAFAYQENTTARMLEGLAQVPGADMAKLTTFETTTQEMSPAELPHRPDLCFVDGEHSHAAVLHDARFCAEALGGAGVIAFHDYGIVQSGIKAFLRERWTDISLALVLNRQAEPATGHGVFALELGRRGVLRHPAIAHTTGARSLALWQALNRPPSALPLVMAWDAMPVADAALRGARRRVRSLRRRG
jgi:hypothetical protein